MTNNDGFTYLASPYSAHEPQVEELRFREAQRATAYLLAEKVWVYSPIVHCHELARLYDLPKAFGFWHDYNFAMLTAAEEFTVLTIEGWKDSVGVRSELEYARHLGKRTYKLTPIDKGEGYFMEILTSADC